MNQKIFKTYDVRGKYPEEITEKDAAQIAKAFARFLNAKSLVIGYDMRNSSKSLHTAIIKGLSDIGVEVINIGLTSTPMHYFSVPFLKKDGGIMITASHNPKNYGGMKFLDKNASPVFKENGLLEVAKIAQKEIADSENKGKIISVDVEEDYVNFLKNELVEFKNFNIVVDTMHGAIGPVAKKVFDSTNLTVHYLATEPDGEIPGYNTPNPMLEENRRNIIGKMEEVSAELGFLWDGDGDRMMVLDSKRQLINSAFIAYLIVKEVLKEGGPKKIVSELRMERVLRVLLGDEDIEIIKTKNGNPYVKFEMDKTGAHFGGESTGHFMFSKSNNAEDTILAAIYFLKALTNETREPQVIFDELNSKSISKEYNFKINTERLPEKIKAKFGEGKEVDELDGVTIQDEETWMNIRESQTEPLLRVNVQATSKEAFNAKLEDVKKFLLEQGGELESH